MQVGPTVFDYATIRENYSFAIRLRSGSRYHRVGTICPYGESISLGVGRRPDDGRFLPNYPPKGAFRTFLAMDLSFESLECRRPCASRNESKQETRRFQRAMFAGKPQEYISRRVLSRSLTQVLRFVHPGWLHQDRRSTVEIAARRLHGFYGSGCGSSSSSSSSGPAGEPPGGSRSWLSSSSSSST